MSIKSAFAIPFAKFIQKKVYRWAENPIKTQKKVFENLVAVGKNTAFGRDHGFESIRTYEAFKAKVPIVDYEGLRGYIERVVAGERDVLWKGKPLYFAKTSGTTSGVKYIPITKESMPTHTRSAKNAILMYIAQTGDASFLDGKMIFLQGSPILKNKNGVDIGRLSGIVAHYVPKYMLKNTLPSWETNCIEDWETKVAAIIEETFDKDMTVISGIPSWVQMYFEKLYEKTGKTISEVFPKFNFFIYGGVNFEPYRTKFENLIGKKIDYLELYPSSEGFIAYQDNLFEKGMLLQLDNGIFYEFIPAKEFYDENPTRISLEEVELGVNYVIILNTTAGLWGYNIGDTVEFTSIKPYRIIVTGRIKHFISAFGEHVIGKEVEQALIDASQGMDVVINEFTVAPQVAPKEGLPYHQWFIEFEQAPENLDLFAKKVDLSMQNQNIYYADLINGKVLKTLEITKVKKGGFHAYMKSIGKFGGQNKIPKLSDNREIANGLEDFIIEEPVFKSSAT